MQALQFSFCAVLLLVVFIESGLALKCYTCNSFEEQLCKTVKKGDPDFLVECPANATGCRKVEQRLTYGGEEHIRFYRQCDLKSAPKKCVERSGTLGVKNFYCNCDEDECNSGSTLTISLTLLAITVTFIELFKRL